MDEGILFILILGVVWVLGFLSGIELARLQLTLARVKKTDVKDLYPKKQDEHE